MESAPAMALSVDQIVHGLVEKSLNSLADEGLTIEREGTLIDEASLSRWAQSARDFDRQVNSPAAILVADTLEAVRRLVSALGKAPDIDRSALARIVFAAVDVGTRDALRGVASGGLFHSEGARRVSVREAGDASAELTRDHDLRSRAKQVWAENPTIRLHAVMKQVRGPNDDEKTVRRALYKLCPETSPSYPACQRAINRDRETAKDRARRSRARKRGA